MSGFTPALRKWAESILGPVQDSEDASWDHGNSNVTRLGLASGDGAYLKCYRSPGKFRQEHSAYRDWCPQLPSCAPLLGATETPARALVIGAMPGRPLLGQSGDGPGTLPVTDQRWAYRQAGRFLRDLHRLSAVDSDPLPIPEAWRLRAQTWARRAGSTLSGGELEAVLEIADSPWPEGVPLPRRVPCHRDFTERNWLVEGDQFTVIDFEHARMDWALVDVERALSAIPAGGAGLAEAFLEGYGCDEGVAPFQLLRRVTVVAALSQVVWAVEHSDEAFERAGRERLRRCLHGL